MVLKHRSLFAFVCRVLWAHEFGPIDARHIPPPIFPTKISRKYGGAYQAVGKPVQNAKCSAQSAEPRNHQPWDDT